MPEGRDVEGEDLVESLVPEVRLLERGRLQHGPASRDVLAIPTRRHLNHLLRAIDRGDPSAGQPLADQRYGHAVSAADLQHAIGWVERQGVHRPHEPFRGLARHAYTLPYPNNGRTWATSYMFPATMTMPRDTAKHAPHTSELSPP